MPTPEIDPTNPFSDAADAVGGVVDDAAADLLSAAFPPPLVGADKRPERTFRIVFERHPGKVNVLEVSAADDGKEVLNGKVVVTGAPFDLSILDDPKIMEMVAQAMAMQAQKDRHPPHVPGGIFGVDGRDIEEDARRMADLVETIRTEFIDDLKPEDHRVKDELERGLISFFGAHPPIGGEARGEVLGIRLVLGGPWTTEERGLIEGGVVLELLVGEKFMGQFAPFETADARSALMQLHATVGGTELMTRQALVVRVVARTQHVIDLLARATVLRCVATANLTRSVA